MRVAFLVFCGLALLACCNAGPAPVVDWTLINTFPHDPTAFTQGLIYEDGIFYESAGLFGKSNLRKVEVTTGNVIQRQNNAAAVFAEGLTSWNNTLVQFTWQAQKGYVWDKDFNLLDEWTYPREGWGLTHDGKMLIMSDGTANLFYLDPATFETVCSVLVTHDGNSLDRLNELEYIYGHVFANVWYDNRIAIVDPQSGEVVGFLDLTALKQKNGAGDVVNGIAYNAQSDTLYVTGKLWSEIYEIQLDKTTTGTFGKRATNASPCGVGTDQPTSKHAH